MSVVSIQNLKVDFGGKVLFENVSFDVNEGDFVGLIGANGTGKTTLFKVITGELEPTEGGAFVSKQTKVGYLEQHACHGSVRTVLDEALSVFEPLMRLEHELESVAQRIDTQSDMRDELIERQNELQERYQSQGGLTYRSRTRAALIGLGFPEADFTLTCDKLSGGQKSKLSMCKLLLSGAQLLLLDEPTNNLDIYHARNLMRTVRALCDELGKTVVLVLHELNYAAFYSDYICAMKNGKIGVTTENIFPVIKKFLYSDHEIFLRELISNSVDATQKLKALASMGDVKGDLGDLTIRVSADKDAKTLTVTDRGIGMTADEVERYINQIAFSSAEEFMEKYKNQAIIGHFGLGFYSAFMVADKVEIFTRSYKEGAKTVHWSCEGSPEYEMEETTEQRDRGTTIVLHLSADTLEYGEDSKVEELLRKYCRFLPVPIAFGKVKEWKDGKYVDTNKDNIINNIAPLWTVKPTEITAEQYKEFYHELYPIGEEPLFSIHLNIDYPFHLTGILYFPKIRNNFEIQKNKIQLYSNQVYVTDQVEGIVPEYLTLLHGVIDSPDIPLNVSRSYLQSDSNVKKISNYITRKVADRLQELFTTMRADYEQKWDDLKIFIEYGIITDEKFAEKAESFMLWKTTEGKYFTAEEYKEVVKGNQTDKNGTVVFLYVDDPVEKNSFLESAKAKGYDVLVMDGQLDNHYVNWYESKHKDARFVRVDSDVIDKLIQKDETLKMSLSEAQQEIMRPVFESQMPKDEKIHYNISFEAMAADAAPVVITQNEFMRRMKEMAAISSGGMSQFYSQMPDNFTIAVNGNNPIVIDILADVEKSYGDKLKTITKKIDAAVAEERRFDEVVKGKKEEELTPEEKSTREELSKKIVTLRDERDTRLREIGGENKLVKQIIDLALLSNGLLKGKNLTEFIQRSISLIEK